MLEVACISPNELALSSSPARLNFSSVKMPVDYASYLLSSSPPGFELAYQFRLEGPLGSPRARRRNPNTLTAIRPRTKTTDDYFSKDDDLDEVSQEIASLLVEEFQSAKSNSLPLIARDRLTYPTDILNKNNCAKGKGLKKKSVSFADDLGKALVQVRLISESTDTPPVIRPEILDSLTQGASATVTTTPPLVLNFVQPASDYVAFRRKLEKNCVSLENVILKDYKLLGTVKVKNIAFEKRVFIRGTVDSWETHIDAHATYVETLQPSQSQYDTFKFEFSVPPSFDCRKKVQFAVCYDTNGQHFWDSNDGANYEIVSANFKSEEEEGKEKKFDNPVFNLQQTDDRWSEFSSWTSADNTIPYW